MTVPDLSGKFCSRPFEWLEIQGHTAHICCPGWVTLGGTSLEGKTVADLWNGEQAQRLRASIHDGSFRHCRREECPFLNQDVRRTWEPAGPPLVERDGVDALRLRRIIDDKLTSLDDGPLILNCGYDRTCNLQCRSCREGRISLDPDGVEREAAFQDRILDEIGGGLRQLSLSGTGDPFASRVYRRLLDTLPERGLEHLELHIHTNATLWTPRLWESLGAAREMITTAHISVDAAKSATYERNRRGARWERLQRNLAFVAELRREGPLRFVTLSFVVQAENFREMPAFIKMTERFGFDLVYFHKLCNWGSYTDEEYRERAVHLPSHPLHYPFLRLLRRPIFDRPSVGLFCLEPCRERARGLRPDDHLALGVSSLAARAGMRAGKVRKMAGAAVWKPLRGLRRRLPRP